MEAAHKGWVEVVKKNIKKEVKEKTCKQVINSTLEEKKLRQECCLKIGVSSNPKTDSTLEEDVWNLCKKLGHEKDPLPSTKAWWGVPTQKRNEGQGFNTTVSR